MISPFAKNYQFRNFADIVYAKTATLHTNQSKITIKYPFKKINVDNQHQKDKLDIIWATMFSIQFVNALLFLQPFVGKNCEILSKTLAV